MTMTSFADYIADYARRNPGFRERSDAIAQSFWADVPDVATFPTILQSECDEPHRGPQGPNEDMGVCSKCWGMSWALRPDDESFGWHISDCSLDLRHESYCVGGGNGHAMPQGWKLRG